MDALPPYAFVPGAEWPHPTRSPDGHSFGRSPRAAQIVGDEWEQAPAYLHGTRLFNAGYYWEAHEAWEALWHAHGRSGTLADLFKGLIKLAAAGVKAREGQEHGVTTHARRAAALFATIRAVHGPRLLGLDIDVLRQTAERIAESPPLLPARPGERVVRVFDFTLEPERSACRS